LLPLRDVRTANVFGRVVTNRARACDVVEREATAPFVAIKNLFV